MVVFIYFWLYTILSGQRSCPRGNACDDASSNKTNMLEHRTVPSCVVTETPSVVPFKIFRTRSNGSCRLTRILVTTGNCGRRLFPGSMKTGRRDTVPLSDAFSVLGTRHYHRGVVSVLALPPLTSFFYENKVAN